MSDHILQVPYVVTKFQKLETYGCGKHRAWCYRCSSLRPKADFTAVRFSTNPNSSHAMYHMPYWDDMCDSCAEKRKTDFMESSEYDRLFALMLHREMNQKPE